MKTNSKKILFALCSLLVLAIGAAAVVFNFSDLLEISPLAGISLAALPAIVVPKNALHAKEMIGTYLDSANSINERAKNEKRNLTNAEAVEFQAYMDYSKEMRNLARTLEVEEARLAKAAGEFHNNQSGTGTNPEQWIDKRSGKPVKVYSKSEKIADDFPEARNLHIGRAVAGLVTGDWTNAESEKRALETGTGGGSYLVPVELAATLIDLARAKMVTNALGAKTLLMPTKSMTIARVTSDPEFEVKPENDAFTPSTVGFDAVSLDAFTVGTIIEISRELAADAPNASTAIQNALVNALAVKLDQLALLGVGTTEPLGIANIEGIQEIDLEGATQISYDSLIDAWGMCADSNSEVTGFILSPRDKKILGKSKNDVGDYLKAPELINSAKMMHTSSLPTNLGTGTDESLAIAGDFNKLIIGIREGMNLEVSAVSGDAFKKHQIHIKLTWRGDCTVEHPESFVKITGIAGETAE